MNELRRHRRMKIPLKVEIRHPSIGKTVVAASDMSDGGVFLLMHETSELRVGESVLVRTLGLGINGSESGPPLIMSVVRQTTDGVGLKLEPTASANLESWNSENLTRQAIRQSLFIANDFEQLLVIDRSGAWCLPSRQLVSGDTWQLGIEAILAELKTKKVTNDAYCVIPAPLCLPAALGEPGSIDLLIPCSITKLNPNEGLSTSFLNSEQFNWVDATELSRLIPCLDSKVIDKALKQVQH
ncbi:MAG: hypothetical protein ACI95C_000937 [Pseudohongiellaceae bacterium]|jgi:hypothetical protein